MRTPTTPSDMGSPAFEYATTLIRRKEHKKTRRRTRTRDSPKFEELTIENGRRRVVEGVRCVVHIHPCWKRQVVVSGNQKVKHSIKQTMRMLVVRRSYGLEWALGKISTENDMESRLLLAACVLASPRTFKRSMRVQDSCRRCRRQQRTDQKYNRSVGFFCQATCS